MVTTVLEARVAPEQWATLESTYREAIKALDTGIVQTSLLQEQKDAQVWQIATVWESRGALEAMRASGQTPRGVLIFREAGAEPVLRVFAVQARAG